jgi:hypothetical protein
MQLTRARLGDAMHAMAVKSKWEVPATLEGVVPAMLTQGGGDPDALPLLLTTQPSTAPRPRPSPSAIG